MLTLLFVAACSKPAPPAVAEAPHPPSADLAAFFERVHAEELASNPIAAAYLGEPHDDTQWSSMSYEQEIEDRDRAQGWLDELNHRFDPATLSPDDQLSIRLFQRRQERQIESSDWFYHHYRVTQMRGTHTWVPSFLVTVHRIEDEASARSWVARVQNAPRLFDELSTVLTEQERRGILPPAFAYPRVLQAIDRLLTGAPFTDGAASPLLAHFQERVDALELPDPLAQELIEQARTALQGHLGPAYERLATQLRAQAPTEDDGAWKLPDGGAYYAYRLRRFTTTDLTPDQIHELGLAEVARIQDEMRSLQPAIGVSGDLQALFAHLRDSEAYTLPNTDEGREAYLQLARDYVSGIEARLSEVFDLLPRAPLEVRRVEPWREGSAGKAFYQGASPDGSRPGIFYANLANTANMPTYQLEALVYHEGLPGHHMQNAVSNELGALPPFRRFGGNSAYGEGWGLYSEYLPKEMGLYTDPASDLGRLAMELWRAARLVVDTGIHDRRWTRAQAIEYLMQNTPNPEGDCIHAIERYIVTPGQATAYKVGMLEILALRERARRALGERFRLVDFHRVVLGNGSVPLDVLGEQVDAWIAATHP